ncbi:MAG: FecR domain-containing protein, partial [Armatimonadetes bacterium]|nr:FecR domain-containing protein [Armatimonadota bacterium]
MKKIFNLIFLLLFLNFFPAFGDEITPGAKFIYLKGAVRVLKAGTNKWIEANENLDLKAQDQIQAEADSQAIILLWDKSSLNLGENTKITLINFNQPEKNIATKFKLFFGKVWADLEKFLDTNSSFEVETPHALAAVRGTSFEMEADD